MKKFDIHSHILPGLDDGSDSMETSLEMLRTAYERGISFFAATPHYSMRYGEYEKEDVYENCRVLQEKARTKISDQICIYPGQEILFTQDALEMLDQGKLLTLAGSHYLLVEFYTGAEYSVFKRAVRELTMRSFRPVIAHVERYEALDEESRVEELIDAGCLIQMNYGSINGKLFDRRARHCRKLLEAGLVHFLGTDMHNTGARSPRIEEACKWMEKHLDEEYLSDIQCRNAGKLINDKRI